ncbi:MAG TPA: low affinity iron permease family protein [Gemmatimonadales bacterium]|jgi:low affinity Fe/Cu permease
MAVSRSKSPADVTLPHQLPAHHANWFRAFAEHAARALGSPWAFIIAVAVVAVWAATGPAFHYSDSWQIVINTGTTIVTFLMVFLLQNTQMRDSKALHLKLDELLRAVGEARTALVGLEQLPDEQLKELSDEMTEIAQQERGNDDTCPPVDDLHGRPAPRP